MCRGLPECVQATKSRLTAAPSTQARIHIHPHVRAELGAFTGEASLCRAHPELLNGAALCPPLPSARPCQIKFLEQETGSFLARGLHFSLWCGLGEPQGPLAEQEGEGDSHRTKRGTL